MNSDDVSVAAITDGVKGVCSLKVVVKGVGSEWHLVKGSIISRASFPIAAAVGRFRQNADAVG